jgi:type III secretion system FlhB-like substrate exporter
MPEIDVKKAVKIASQYLKVLYGNTMANARVEEVEVDENDDWLITLSFVDIEDLVPERVYKTLAIDSETGEVLAMRIREVS